ncbi:MAG: NAD(P)-dependent oxidoreductase [Acidobacteria bacterium]|nr:NAD(P)-dependent oxidoreductase [Acidobacteriota bacterium]
MAELSIEEIEQNFAEINPPLTEAEAFHEANRCLYCYDAPCTEACPTHIDVPAFIKKIASGNLTGAARVIFDANPIGGSCARVCPVEVLCEGACVEKTLVKKPIEIGRLQRYATDSLKKSGRQLFAPGAPNGKSVGIIGSGPAGLSAATYLARLGYAVTVYEKRPLAGGLDTYGMAEYKMPQTTSLEEVRMVEALGVGFELNSEIVVMSEPPALTGGEVRARLVKFSLDPFAAGDDLLAKHDAIFLAVGLGKTNKLNIAGEDLDGVCDALHFIEQVKTRDWKSVPLGRTIAVIGAGNTAIDAVTQAKRLGADRVMLVYRRAEMDAPAYEYEIELAKKDGVEFVWQTTPLEILGDGRVTGLKCRKADGSEVEIPCDMVVKAIGQAKQGGFFQSLGLETDQIGRVVVNESMQTANPRIFAGGDCVNGGREAVDASQMGKLAAQGIHLSLTGENIAFAGNS